MAMLKNATWQVEEENLGNSPVTLFRVTHLPSGTVRRVFSVDEVVGLCRGSGDLEGPISPPLAPQSDSEKDFDHI